MKTCIFGATGRLGMVIIENLTSRGDEISKNNQEINYLVFAHRYRGEADYGAEMEANVGLIADSIRDARWADGDCAIVIVASVSAMQPDIGQSLAYNLSKAAQLQLARYYAKMQPVRINTVSPATFTGPAAVISPQQVADVVAFLCSPQASGINGQDIRVTG